MSNSNNIGKELKRLRKELDALEQKARGFHFLVHHVDDDPEPILQARIASGQYANSDVVEFVAIPWRLRELTGNLPPDPLADDYENRRDADEGYGGMNEHAERGASLSGLAPDPSPFPATGQLERWKKHERAIELDGTRYDPDKPKGNDGIW